MTFGWPRRQPPVHSPVPMRPLARLPTHVFRLGPDPRAALAGILGDRFGADRVVLTASGTHALTLALRAARPDLPDAPVLLPAYTCFEVATAAVAAGRRVALYDVAPLTLEPDWDSVRRAARGPVAALVVAPLYGCGIDWSAARAIARDLDTILIEDAAQAHGSSTAGRPAGSHGDVSILSFGRGKGWTGAGGGALLLRGPAATAPIEPLREAGRTAELRVAMAALFQRTLARPSTFWLPASIPALRIGETKYHAPSPVRAMTRTSAALALASDQPATGEARIRRDRARRYREQLGLAETTLDRTAGMLRFPIRVRGGWDAARARGLDTLGAGPPYPSTLADLAPLAPLRVNPTDAVPGADSLVAELVTLPTHSLLRASEVAAVVARASASESVASPQQRAPAPGVAVQS